MDYQNYPKSWGPKGCCGSGVYFRCIRSMIACDKPMNYYLFRHSVTKEATAIFATTGVMHISAFTEMITKAQYETYKIFGIPEAKTDGRYQVSR